MSSRTSIGVMALLLAAAPVYAQQPTAAGRVKVVTGQAFIVRAHDCDRRAARAAGLRIRQPAHRARRARSGSLSRTTRGCRSGRPARCVSTGLYGSADGSLALALKVVRGVTAYVSGRIAKLAPDSVRLETPSAIVGVRGTSLLIRADN